jgi:hypothetical protein
MVFKISYRNIFISHILERVQSKLGARGSVVVNAVWYKPEGRGISSR